MLDDLRHAYVDLEDPTHLEFAYTQLLGDVADAVASGRRRAIDAVHVGGGGFTMPRYLEATRPGSDSVVFELDPGVVELAEDELGLRLDQRLRVMTGDARGHLAERADGVGRSRHRRRLRRAGRALAPGDAGVRHGRRPGPATGRHLRPERHRPTPAALPRRRSGDAARGVRHVAVLGAAGAVRRHERRQHRSSSPATRRCRSTPSEPQIAARGDDDVVVSDDAGLDELVGGSPVLTDEYAPVDQLLT